MLFEFLHLNNQRLSSSLWRRDKFKWVAGSQFWFSSRRIYVCTMYIVHIKSYSSLFVMWTMFCIDELSLRVLSSHQFDMHIAQGTYETEFQDCATKCRCSMSNVEFRWNCDWVDEFLLVSFCERQWLDTFFWAECIDCCRCFACYCYVIIYA